MTIPRAQAYRRVHTVKYALSNLRGSEVQGLLLWSRRLWLVEVVGEGDGVRNYGCSTGGGYSVYVGMMSVLCVLECGAWCCVDGLVESNDALNTVHLPSLLPSTETNNK